MARIPASAITLIALAALASPATARDRGPPPPTGELLLDMDDPVINLMVGDVPLKLRVSLNQKRLIELNPDAAQRLRENPPTRQFAFESGFEAQVGREIVRGIQAAAPVSINGRDMLVSVASHERPCCADVDGEIGIGLLPYAVIRMQRGTGPDDVATVATFAIDDNVVHGPQASQVVGRDTIFLQFSLERSDSVATGSAGAIVARRYGGRLAEPGMTVAAFGIERPVSMLALKSRADIAGFGFDRIAVRTADFAGREQFPSDPDEPGEILVKRKVTQQEAWPVVLIGRDRLDRCSEIRFDGITHQLSLRCRWQGAPS